MLPTMIPQIHFYDSSRKCFKITYYEKNYMQTAYYSYNTLIASTHQNGWDAMAKHVEHLIEIDELSSEIEETKARRMNDTQYNINCCASSFNWEPLDQSFRSEGHDQTLARVFEGAYRQYIDENYDGICDADKDTEEECESSES